MAAEADNNLGSPLAREGWWLSKHVLRRPPTSAKSSAKLSWHGASRAAREEACFPKGKLPKILRRIGIGAPGLPGEPLPHHLACGPAPGGSKLEVT